MKDMRSTRASRVIVALLSCAVLAGATSCASSTPAISGPSNASGVAGSSVPAFEGLYYPPARGYPPRIDGQGWTILERTGEQWWVFSRERPLTAATAQRTPDGAWSLHLVDGGTIPVAQTSDGAWHASGDALVRHDDVLASRMLARRAGPHVLVSAQEPREGQQRSTIELNGPVFAWRRNDECHRAVFIPDPTLNGEKPVPPPQALPPRGKLGSRSFIALEIEVPSASDPNCRATVDASRVTPYARGFAGGYAYAQENGDIVAIQLIGYMASEVFIAPGQSQADIEALMKANERELDHQAE